MFSLAVKIGAYEVLDELGRGAMGVVYRVRAREGGLAALKLLQKRDPLAFGRFERERRLLGTLGEREGFVGLLDAGSSPAGPWLVMPLVPGGALRQRLDQGPLAVDETLSIGIALASALGRAHERGIVHRDVKPENVLFTASGRGLLADLGLAKHFDPDAAGASLSVRLTRAGVITGTAAYMAPEQLGDAASVGPASDVFALGAVLFECLAGRPAFEGKTVLEVLTKLGSGTTGPIGRVDVPAWLEATIRRTLVREPLERFADGAALARALEQRGVPGASGARSARPLLLGAAAGAAVLAGLALAPRTEPRLVETPRLVEKPRVEARTGEVAAADPPARPLSALDHARRGVELNERGDWDRAIVEHTRAIELDPTLAEAWINRGRARFAKDDFDGEIADETRAIELDPRLEAAWANRGSARAAKGDLDGALADQTKALELDPSIALVWSVRGGLRDKKGDLEGALADLTRALELDPRLAVAWRNRAAVRINMKDMEGVVADESRVIELGAAGPLDWVNRGWGRGKLGDWDGALADATRALELDPGLSIARQTLGWALFEKGEWKETIASDTKALELDPLVVDSWVRRGGARANSGDFEGAISDETRAIELDPKLAHAWEFRGIARFNLGDSQGAVADLERSLELYAGKPDAARVAALLETARKRAR